MKYLVSLLLLCLLFRETHDARTWKNLNGSSIEAELVGLDGDHAILLKKGKEYRVPLESLSEDDQRFIEEAEKSSPENPEPEPTETPDFPLKLNTWVSGDKIDPIDAAGRPIVLHAWQAHCSRCPEALKEFDKLARRKKKTRALFMIWHSYDKVELAKQKSESLDLDASIYHGKMIKWNKRFGEPLWPHVIVMASTGEIIYMGAANRDFEKALKALTN